MKYLTIIATTLAIIVSGITIYKHFVFRPEGLTIEQTIDPETLDKINNPHGKPWGM